MDKEQWKPIKGYEGFYEVSSFGRVKSIKRVVYKTNGKKMTVNERILKTYINKGYEYVDLCKKAIYEHKKVHRLVAESFIPNPINLPFVNHKDENKINNKLTNLEWCTPIYNANYGNAKLKLREAQIKTKGIPICQLSLEGELIKVFSCTKDVEKDGFDRRAVYRCCNGKSLTHKGYMFSFKK